MEIHVLRLGHRLPRDERITTHVALVARAFGADEITYAGQKDGSFEDSVKRITENWGGKFPVSYSKSPVSTIKKYKKEGCTVIHLTMYGIPVPEAESKIKSGNKEKILIVVGAERVPMEIYELADFNIAVTNQPHSEVAALAITLDRLQKGKELKRNFNEKFRGKLKIRPNKKGKTVEKS